MFDWKKPTVQMLGRWQPWHKGHQELFKRCWSIKGQVVIMVRDVHGASCGEGQDDNPFNFDQVKNDIIQGLSQDGFENTDARRVREKLQKLANQNKIKFVRYNNINGNRVKMFERL